MGENEKDRKLEKKRVGLNGKNIKQGKRMIDSRTKETNATQAPTNEGIKKENKSEPDTTSNWQEKRSRKKGLAVAIFAGFGVFLVYLFLLFENIRIYNDLRFSESPFSELNSLPKLTIHREEIGLDWQKNPCKPSSMICDAVPRWIPLTASDKTATQEQCSFYTSRIRFDGKFRNITMIKNCLGLMTNLHAGTMDLKQEARQICGTLDASLPRPKTKDDILQIINFAMQILPNIFDRPEFSAGDTVAYLNRRTMTDYSFVTANNIGKLADSDGNILDNFSFISRNTLGELDPEYSYLTVDVRDSHGNCDPYCVKMEPRSLFKWSIQSVDPERGLYATLVCFYENGFDWTISHHDKNIRDDFTWYEPNMFNNFSILQAWDRKGNAWEELGQNAAFSTLTVFQGVNNPFYGIAIRDSEEACQLLGGKLIESDKELHFFIKAFQRAFEDEQETLTYNQLANLRIPLKIGIPTFLDMQQNCSESGTKEHKETRCGSRVFDPSEYIDIDIVPVYNHDESGGTVVSTLDLNWFNYLQGRNLLRLFRPKSAAVDQICIQK